MLAMSLLFLSRPLEYCGYSVIQRVGGILFSWPWLGGLCTYINLYTPHSAQSQGKGEVSIMSKSGIINHSNNI